MKDGEAWTPSDSVALDALGYVYVNDPGGDVAVKFASGRTFIFKSYIGWLPCKVKYVLATGTTVGIDLGVFF